MAGGSSSGKAGPSNGAGGSSGAPPPGGPSRAPPAAGSSSRPSRPKSARDIRRERNLASAKASRQRKREGISALEQEHARINEVNALLRARLNISPSGPLPPVQELHRLAALKPGHHELGPAMRKLAKKNELESKVLVDLLDRALAGGRGRGPPLDPELCRAWEAAMRKAPKDQPRPYKYVEKHGGMDVLGPNARGRGTVSKGGPLAGPRPGASGSGDNGGRGSSSKGNGSKDGGSKDGGASGAGSSGKR
ncbi:hypothetical protein BWQ96_01249 [Gracilariopsis chorda]|uniref:BZIP domain-containing protein n=1 Tax=Gracilariopsis chorda TaxID=448386 RepID=A0A2V3J4I7_9FLOR|nr:hypothetical protein BWQ96_01249 [Gracilariopsis chorda]|eukprot:PXF48907.1 hypothetical protein BWQ96_01249 [Gracilariopsis chorda]